MLLGTFFFLCKALDWPDGLVDTSKSGAGRLGQASLLVAATVIFSLFLRG